MIKLQMQTFSSLLNQKAWFLRQRRQGLRSTIDLKNCSENTAGLFSTSSRPRSSEWCVESHTSLLKRDSTKKRLSSFCSTLLRKKSWWLAARARRSRRHETSVRKTSFQLSSTKHLVWTRASNRTAFHTLTASECRQTLQFCQCWLTIFCISSCLYRQ